MFSFTTQTEDQTDVTEKLLGMGSKRTGNEGQRLLCVCDPVFVLFNILNKSQCLTRFSSSRCLLLQQISGRLL